MHRVYTVLPLIVALALSACMKNYQYTARGSLPFDTAAATSTTPNALVYWHRDEGKWMFFFDHRDTDNFATLRTCMKISRPEFRENSQKGTIELEAPLKGSDLLLAQIDAEGRIKLLNEQAEATPETACGYLVKTGTSPTNPGITMDAIEVGDRIDLIFLCQSRKGGKYPPPGRYAMERIYRTETPTDSEGNRTAPDPCSDYKE